MFVNNSSSHSRCCRGQFTLLLLCILLLSGSLIPINAQKRDKLEPPAPAPGPKRDKIVPAPVPTSIPINTGNEKKEVIILYSTPNKGVLILTTEPLAKVSLSLILKKEKKKKYRANASGLLKEYQADESGLLVVQELTPGKYKVDAKLEDYDPDPVVPTSELVTITAGNKASPVIKRPLIARYGTLILGMANLAMSGRLITGDALFPAVIVTDRKSVV